MMKDFFPRPSSNPWFKPVTGLFSKKSKAQPVSGFVVNRPDSDSRSPRPQLSISIEQTLTATPRDLPKIDSTPTSQPSMLPWMKNIPPEIAIPFTIPPPPPSRTRNANVPVDVGSTSPDHGPLATPLHNAFEERLASQNPVHLPLYPTFLAAHFEGVSSQKKHKHLPSLPMPSTPLAAVPFSQHEATRSTSRLLTNIHAQDSDDAVDPFATPFDDDAFVSPAKTKRVTNTFAGFAL